MPQHGHFIPSSFRERPSLVPPARIDPLGVVGPTPGQARGPQWRRSSRGLYVPSYVDATVVEQRILEAAAVLPPVGGVTGWAGLRWMGGEWFDGLDPRGPGHLPVDLATCYQDIRTQAGFVVHQERLGPSELVRYDGLTCTSAVRSLCFLMRYARSLREATSFADLAAYSDLVSIAEATDYFLAHPGWTGIPQARDALALADENSWSRWETWMRLVWELDAGFPRPLCNRPVFDLDGNHIATPDLLDVESGTAGEYDGAVHLQGAQRSRDAERENRLRNVGLEPFVAFASDLPRPERAIRRMADARNRARWEPESRRRWTINPPPWWISTHTVEQRRQLNTSQRARLLRRRAA